MSIFGNLFGGNKKEKVLKDLAHHIVGPSYVVSSDAINDWEEIKDVSLFRMTLGLSEALIHATDRIAHGMELANRYEVMETLIDEVSKMIVDLFMDKNQISINDGLERIKSEIHTSHLYLGQFPMQLDDGSLKGTFTWEMSKMVAKDIDKENDPAVMMLVQDLYVKILTEIQPKAYLARL
jgi:hypothetical protein